MARFFTPGTHAIVDPKLPSRLMVNKDGVLKIKSTSLIDAYFNKLGVFDELDEMTDDELVALRTAQQPESASVLVLDNGAVKPCYGTRYAASGLTITALAGPIMSSNGARGKNCSSHHVFSTMVVIPSLPGYQPRTLTVKIQACLPRVAFNCPVSRTLHAELSSIWSDHLRVSSFLRKLDFISPLASNESRTTQRVSFMNGKDRIAIAMMFAEWPQLAMLASCNRHDGKLIVGDGFVLGSRVSHQ